MPQPSSLLARLDRPLVEAQGLPADAYTGPAFAAVERDRVLARSWLAVAVGADLPQPGDALPVDAVGQPIVLVRGRDGTIRAFHNVCMHRGLKLVEAACHGQLLRCPYHSWAYDLEGALRATPFFGGMASHEVRGFDPAANGLKPVRLARWHDLILVNLSGDAPDFGDYAAALYRRWQAYDFAAASHTRQVEFEVAANWKLIVENFCDTYHLPFVHPQVNEYSKAEDHYDVIDGFVVGTGNLTAARDEPGAEALPRFPGLPESLARSGEFLALFPNTLIFLMPDHYFTVTVTPVDHGRSIERLDFYFPGEGATAERFGPRREALYALWGDLNVQDIGMVERLQRGRVSRAFEGGCFSPALEAPIHHVQSLVARLMEDADA
ncbi:aromatic ring-hydroxylating dioxygenase subunit alpha [Oleomonas cavernae]|uniref:Aromatic ring-hydroxylating dioxygenase subunit alpha n=1 Tax=Oleomonas cavernae TaxID=2320859 RepID=A0A418WAQ6_9PROT|nr:aromatic ring-hydroxylating dioxygenase subunit alpha [Oleomonas cavernae]RJF87133.1 aromatic ring-hydroxylating dioxygenase subunit alpha [Oleomonas cavernae]